MLKAQKSCKNIVKIVRDISDSTVMFYKNTFCAQKNKNNDFNNSSLLCKSPPHGVSKWSECAHASGVWRVCARSGLDCASAGSDLLRRLSQRARAHVTHRMRVRIQITWTWLCTRGKKRYKYCLFSHTNRSFRVLGHQCVVTMGNCLIWISLCMFFFPLIETVTYTCHYMTDRLERFDLKISKLDLLKKKRHLHLGCPWGNLIDTKF